MSGSEAENSESGEGSTDMDFNLDPEELQNQDPDKFWDEVTNKSGKLEDEPKEGMYTYDQARELGLLEEDSKDD
jgi:hypothetical protein